MGTRSTTAILDENGNQLVKMYRQFDGYPTGLGQEIADFLKARTVVNGFGGDMTAKTHANGMGCLAAQLITYLKGDSLGNVYITHADDSQQYNYTVYLKDENLCFKVESPYSGVLFDGLASDFNGVVVEESENEEEEV